MRSLNTKPLTVATRMILVGSLAMLAACGQKGPLYLPDQVPPANKPFSACDVPDAPCRTQQEAPASGNPRPQPLPESSTVPGVPSTEPIAP